MARLGIQSKKEFVKATSARGQHLDYSAIIKKGPTRGTTISYVDSCLGKWDKIHGLADTSPANVEKKRKCLRTLAKACAFWLSRNAGKNTPLSSGRESAIKAILDSALTGLGTFDSAEEAFARRKISAITNNRVTAGVIKTPAVGIQNVKDVRRFQRTGTKSLDGSYGLEREHYLRDFKPQGRSFTGAAGLVHSNPQEFPSNTDWDTLDLKGYADVYEAISGAEGNEDASQVSYLPKAERLQYLVVVDNDDFATPQGASYHSARTARDIWGGGGVVRIGDMWAMDRYGNLFIKDSRQINGKGYFNHSSFNAGSEVMCAGVILVTNGKLAYIDNASGHYKPTEQHLRSACVFLRTECGVDFSQVCVGVRGAAGISKFTGQSFLSGTNAPWNAASNALRNLPAGDIGAE